jgi:hypothetical protein
VVSRCRSPVCVDQCAKWDNVGLVSIPAQADGWSSVARQPGHVKSACGACWQAGSLALESWRGGKSPTCAFHFEAFSRRHLNCMDRRVRFGESQLDVYTGWWDSCQRSRTVVILGMQGIMRCSTKYMYMVLCMRLRKYVCDMQV